MNLSEGALSDLLRLVLWYPYRWSVPLMAPARELELSRRMAHLLAWLDPPALSRVIGNLQRAFPGRTDLRALAYACVESRIESQYLNLSFEKLDQTTLPSYLSFEGLSRLDEILARGRGCILAYPHMGPIMLPVFGLGLLGYRPSQILAQDEPEGASPAALAAYRIRQCLESRVPATIVNARSYLRPTLRRLRHGELVLVSYDGTGGGEEVGRRVQVTMLGQQVLFPVGALYLAHRSGAPLLPMVTLPSDGCERYKTVIGHEFVLEQCDDLREMLRKDAQRLALELDSLLTRHPGSWHLWPEFEPGRMIEPTPEGT